MGQTDLAKKFKSVITQSGLNPKRLEVEVTESVLMLNTDSVLKTLSELREFCVSIAMDDFGTDYSSLSHLSDAGCKSAHGYYLISLHAVFR
ncbi:EAL domain-containing protein [Granulosicoccus antarcticus]|uniref:Putative signaling protein n=1 Tax=Granulosicoccus antarcticus IMCC3135 TaxID=1192854 RepID=A0A2Z2NKT2_9GAMM|nr:EAL domain-containing protein [Granulosicoccus antarcticus]ASJ71916.1 putative signaling protein [Granulosicoccus antarcticus IMCC3135]